MPQCDGVVVDPVLAPRGRPGHVVGESVGLPDGGVARREGRGGGSVLARLDRPRVAGVLGLGQTATKAHRGDCRADTVDTPSALLQPHSPVMEESRKLSNFRRLS